jgi:cytochrome c oxidase subunit 2
MRFKRLLLSGLAVLSTAGFAAATGPVDGGIGFQESVTPGMDRIQWFHNVMVFPIITAITLFVLVLMIYIMFRFNEKANPVPSKTSHNAVLEAIWTIVPVIILLILVVPAMNLLYYQDTIEDTEMSVKATGNTWNWEYAYPDHPNVEPYISNVLDKDAADAAGKSYLFGTDAPLVVPVDTKIEVLVTSNNNLHAFAMPPFGIKIDAVPGRINRTWFKVHAGKEGTYYGQCSEICGVRHAYMPIEIKVVSKAEFAKWVANDGAFSSDVADNSGGSLIPAAQE